MKDGGRQDGDDCTDSGCGALVSDMRYSTEVSSHSKGPNGNQFSSLVTPFLQMKV